MTLHPNPTIQLIEKNPEVKAFIYQQANDFEPFVTPQTLITVVARDPLKLALQYETDGVEISKKDLKKLYRIAVALQENDSKIEAEGVHENIFEAILLAKNELLAKLFVIQDSVVTHQERLTEINHYLQNHNLH